MLFCVMGGSRCQARLSPFQLLFFKKDKEKRKLKQPNTTAQAPVCAVGGRHEFPLSNHNKASVSQRGALEQPCQAGACHSVEVSS